MFLLIIFCILNFIVYIFMDIMHKYIVILNDGYEKLFTKRHDLQLLLKIFSLQSNWHLLFCLIVYKTSLCHFWSLYCMYMYSYSRQLYTEWLTNEVNNLPIIFIVSNNSLDLLESCSRMGNVLVYLVWLCPHNFSHWISWIMWRYILLLK